MTTTRKPLQIKNEINSNSLFSEYFRVVLCFTLIISLFSLYHTFQLFPFFLLGVSALFFCSLCLPIDSFFLIYIALVPNVYTIKLIGYPNALIGYSVLIAIIKDLVKEQFKFKIHHIILAHAVSVFFTAAFHFDISLFLSLIRTVIVVEYLIGFFNQNLSVKYKKCMVVSFSAGTCLCIIWGLVYYTINGINVFSGYFSGINNDRNYYSATIAITISILVPLMLGEKNKLFFSIMLMFAFFGGIISGSRAFILSLIWVFIELLLLLPSRKYMKQVIIITFFILIIFVLMKDQLLEPLQRLIKRFGEDNIYNGSGRTDAWKYYMSVFFDNPLNMMLGASSRVDSYHGIVQHNTFIEALSKIGLLGTITLGLSFYKLYKSISPWRCKSVVFFFPVLVLCTAYFFINALYADTLTIGFVVCFSVISIMNDNNSKNKDINNSN